MALVSGKILLDHALKNNYAVGAFNFNDLEVLQAIIEAAVAERSPVIVAATQGAIAYAGIEYIVAMVQTASMLHKNLPIALHLDHATNIELCKKAIDAGFTSVMIDGSKLPYEENVRVTKEVVKYAHRKGVSVEAELGRIVGIEDELIVEKGEEIFTNPTQAKQFVERTQCDFLAVAIGTSHGAYKFQGVPSLDLKRLVELEEALPNFPLVLHGASSVPESIVKLANTYGAKLQGAKGVPTRILKKVSKRQICKVNTDTDLRIAVLGAIRKYIQTHPEDIDMRHYMKKAKDAVKKTVANKMRVLGSSKQMHN